jgi:hypothetical protein
MSDITIYHDSNTLEAFSTSDYTLEQLQELHNTATVFGNKAKIAQCCVLYKIKDTLYKKHNTDKNRDYSRDASKILLALGIKKSVFNKDAAVGKYVLEQKDISLFDLPKSAIESKFVLPKLPKAELKPRTVKKKPESDVIILSKSDYEHIKRESVYFQALMDYMGDKADAILTNALKTGSS